MSAFCEVVNLLVFVFVLVYKLRNMKNGLPLIRVSSVAANGDMK